MRRDAGGDSGSKSGAIARLYRELREAALEPPRSGTPFDFWGRAAFWLGLAYYGKYYISLAVSRSQTRVAPVDYILSNANLVFHEAGQFILIPLGSFLSTLGGVTGRDVPGYHDWNNLLARLDMLELDRPLATLADTLGTLLILVALAWAAYLLWLLDSTPRRASDLSD